MKFKVSLFDDLLASRVGGVDDRQLILFSDVINGLHEGHKVVFVVDILFPVGGEQEISFRL